MRLIAAKPWPPTVKDAPSTSTSMSVQRAKSRSIWSWTTASAPSIPPRVSSENTTPKPKVSSGALRSQTVTSWRGSSPFISAAK